MSYTPKTYNEIFLDYLTDAYALGILGNDDNLTTYITANREDIENTIVIELSIHAIRLADFYDQLTVVRNEQNMALANYPGLVILGQMFLGEPRAEDSAITEITFGINAPIADNILIPASTGIRSKTNDSIVFYTYADATLLAGQTWVKANVRCNMIGPVGNVAADDLTEFIVGTNLDYVTNQYPATGGVYAEPMESYRMRLLNWKYILPKGTYDAIKNAIENVPSVNSYYIDQYWDGYGSTKIIIDPPLQIVMDMVSNQVDTAKAIDEDILIVPVETVPIDVSCNINISIDQIVAPSETAKESIKILAEQALRTFIDGGINTDGTIQSDLGISTDFVPFEAAMYIATQIKEIKNVTFDFPNEPVTIVSHEKAVSGTITVVVV